MNNKDAETIQAHYDAVMEMVVTWERRLNACGEPSDSDLLLPGRFLEFTIVTGGWYGYGLIEKLVRHVASVDDAGVVDHLSHGRTYQVRIHFPEWSPISPPHLAQKIDEALAELDEWIAVKQFDLEGELKERFPWVDVATPCHVIVG